jgi:hypothetical protein
MFAIPSFSITPSTLRDLLNFAAANGNPDRAAEFADQAIREWLACARDPTHATCRAWPNNPLVARRPRAPGQCAARRRRLPRLSFHFSNRAARQHGKMRIIQ